ncbi:MAG: Bax inhibitor-1/YccA family protein [Chitinophagaceae bacterium]|nr:Bax inhibitor-1/YccA family protein [Chitinophagaceae bacterium]MCW5914136.1 Bax inhibitor-1/YccA family protein [Chitinophagaceae bacterium]MCZ2395059.1 Bax inhibitor-1/YccA family protein [Chitinophagales bacterium]
MDYKDSHAEITTIDYVPIGEKSISKSFVSNVFMLMFLALGVSALFAWQFSANENLMTYMITDTGMTGLGKIVMFSPLVFVLIMSFAFQRLSATALMGIFLAYAMVNGIAFSFILAAFTPGSVLGCFLSAAAMFGIMAVMGYTTDKDLTSFGRIMKMGVIGILIAIVINFFLNSSQLDYIISIIGVLIFTGLTAYDVQKLKRIGEGIQADGSTIAANTRKLSIMGALTLYLDFINIFLFLLRMAGNRK